MENKTLSGQESLELIARMIQSSRNRLERDSGLPFLIWGYATVAVSLAVWLTVTRTLDPRWFWLWFALPVVAVPLTLLVNRKNNTHAATYLDRIMGYIWWVLGAAAFILSFTAFFYPLPILFLIVLLMGMGTAVTGLIIRFPVCSVAGFVSMLVLAPLCLLVKGVDSVLVFAAVFVVMMIVPGHVLQYKCKRSAQ